MKTFRRMLAVLLALVMSMSVIGLVASAATTDATIDTTKTGSITVHKYEYNGTEKGTGTGETQTPPDGSEALEGVEFTLYKVMGKDDLLAYYNGESTNAVTVDTYVENGAIKSGVAIGEPVVKTTGEDGTVTFEGLELGLYVIIETKAPENVTKAADPFLVSVPMTQASTDANWLYDINVYPKNSTSEGNVTLNKVDEAGNPLENVTFKLEKKTADDPETWTQVGDQVTTTATGVLEWTGLAFGDYRITEISAPDGYIVDQRPIEFTVTQDNKITSTTERACVTLEGTDTAALTITLKNEKPDADKTLADGSEAGNAAIGDTVSYKVTIDVPENITDLKTFTLTDTPTNLDDDEDSVALTCENSAVATNAYAVAQAGTGFTITFVPANMSAYAGKQIIVTYNATVQPEAVSGTALNTVDLTYSNKIHPDSSTSDGDDDKNHIQDSGIVYTYKIDITKYKDSATAGNELGNVEFEVYMNDSDEPLRFVQWETSTGSYRLFPGSSAQGYYMTSLKTDSNGKLVIAGLDAGTYYLKEIKTADGYNLLKDKVEVNLNVDTVTNWETSSDFVNGVLVKETYDSTTYKVGDDTLDGNYVSETIINKKGFNLPATGGLGTLMFIVIGAVLIGGGVCLLKPRKRAV